MPYGSFKDLTFKKKLEHIWFYYKWYIVAAAVLLFAVAVSMVQVLSKPNYDLTVLWSQSGRVSARTVELAAEELEKYCPDFNGDGEINVDVRFVGLDESTVVAPSEAGNSTNSNGEFVDQYALMYKQQLLAEMAAGDSMIYIFDDHVYNMFKDVTDFYDLSSKFDCACVEGDRIKVSKTSLKTLLNNDEKIENHILLCGPNTIKAQDKKSLNQAFEVIEKIINEAPQIKNNPCGMKE